MAIQFPSVEIREKSQSTNINVAELSSYAGFAGNFEWGVCEEVTIITDENELVDQFGKSNADTYIDYLVCKNFLDYSSSLKMVRVIDNYAVNSVAGNTAVQVKNADDYLVSTITNSGDFMAKFPGSKGDSLFVGVCDSGATLSANVASNSALGTWDDYFTTLPGTSTHASQNGGSLDEMHIIVIDEDGEFTGSPGTVLEKYEYVSKAINAKKEDGTSNWYKNLINDTSSYLRIGDTYVLDANSSTTIGTTFSASGNTVVSLSGGLDANTSNTAMYTNAYDLFSDPKVIDISHLISGNCPNSVKQELITMAESRGDCVAYLSPSFSDVQPGQTQSTIVSNLTTFKNTTIGYSSSYYFVDNNWKYQYDRYNDVYRWVPLNGDIAGLSSRCDLNNEPWFSFGGYNRGILKNVQKLAWNPKDEYMGEIYKISINPVISEETGMTLLLGDKTGLAKPSGFDRINVRKLFNTLKGKTKNYLKYSLFEFNDEFTRDSITSVLTAYLQSVKSKRGIYEFAVVCNTSNNTPVVIDSNQLVVDIYIWPSKSANYIQLTMINVDGNLSFNELLGVS